MATKRSIRGVIFDVDGTLIDSNDAHARAWVETLEEFDITVAYDDVRRLIGMGGDKLLPELCNIDKDSDLGKQISDRRAELFKRRYLGTVTALPGSHDLLVRLRDTGLRLAVASSAKKEELAPFLKIAGAEGLFEEKTSSDDAASSKPDPDIVAAALDRLGLDPEEVVMIGDTPYDVEAANRARIDVIAFRSGGWGDEDLAAAVAVYDGPADLLESLDESPLG